MPRYFFNRTNGGVDRDEEGVELYNLEAAKIEAVIFAGSTIRDDPEKLWAGHDYRIYVSNEAGALLFAIVVQAIEASAATRATDTGIFPTEED